MTTLVLIIHLLVCLGLILVVLLQAGKGANMGAAFGGSSQTVFGSAGATTFLAKLTTAVAVVFMLTSLGLAMFMGRSTAPSVVDEVPMNPPAQSAPAPETTSPAPQAAPAMPVTPAPAAEQGAK